MPSSDLVIAGVALTSVAISGARPGFDLTFPQWRVLVVLGEATDGARIGTVARRVGVTLPATSRQLRRLECPAGSSPWGATSWIGGRRWPA